MGLSTPTAIIGLTLAVVLAVVGLFRPFLGMLVLVVIHFVQPGELIPALAPFRVELIYGLLFFVSFLISRKSPLTGRWMSNPIFASVIVLLGYCALTVPFAIWRGGAFTQTIELAKLVFMLIVIGNLVDTNRRLRTVVWLLIGLLVWYAGTALNAYRQGEFVFAQGIDRAVGLTSVVGGPNELGGLITALLPFLIAAFRSTRGFLLRIPLLLIFPLALAAVVVTGSRSGMLKLVFIGAYYVFQSRYKMLSALGIAALAAVLWVAMPVQYQQRYLTVMTFAEGGELDASNEIRVEVWKAGLRMFADHPVLGVGAGQFSTAYGTVYSGRAHGAWFNPHNLLLQVACELGIIGLILFGYFVVQIVKGNHRIFRETRQTSAGLNHEVAVACGAYLIGLAVASTFGHTLYRPYWYLIGGVITGNASAMAAERKDAADRVPEADIKKTEEEHAALSSIETGVRN